MCEVQGTFGYGIGCVPLFEVRIRRARLRHQSRTSLPLLVLEPEGMAETQLSASVSPEPCKPAYCTCRPGEARMSGFCCFYPCTHAHAQHAKYKLHAQASCNKARMGIILANTQITIVHMCIITGEDKQRLPGGELLCQFSRGCQRQAYV
jgi:hypothetical protein